MNECMVNKGTSSLIMNTFLNIKHVAGEKYSSQIYHKEDLCRMDTSLKLHT